MCWRCDDPLDEAPVLAPNPPHLQCRHHTASYRETDRWQHDRHNEQTVDQRLACNRTTNALIGVSWPTTISQVQEMSWNSTIFEVTMNVSSMSWTTDLVGIACQNRLCFLLMTTLIRNFYKAIMQRLDTKKVGLRTSSRIKTFVFKFISVPAKWIKTSRQHVLNIYTENYAYAKPFQTDFG